MSNRFSKLDAQGLALPADATKWVAVHDTSTGLTWSAHEVTKKSVAHERAEKAVAKLDLAGACDWRLPTVDELCALADRTSYSPAIDTDFFPTCRSDWYWTSTPAAWSSSNAWFIDFSGGSGSYGHRSYPAFVRAVRSVPAAPAP